MKSLKCIPWCYLVIFLSFPIMASAEAGDGVDSLSLSDLLNIDITTASLTSQKISEAPSIVSVVTADDIKNMGARDIVDVIRTVPGFDYVEDFSSPILVIRGTLNSNKVNIMLNGYPLKVNNNEVSTLFRKIPIGNIKQIEIIRGPGSALYGTGAFTGVINIKTWEGGDSLSGLSISGGSYDTGKAEAKLSYGKDDLNAYCYADYFRTDGYDGMIEKDYAPYDQSIFPFSGSAAPGKMTSDEDYYTLQTHIKYKNLFFQGLYSNSKNTYPVSPAKTLTDENETRMQYVFGEAGYDWQINDELNMLFKTGYSYTDRKVFTELFSEEATKLINYIHQTFGVPGGGYPKGESIIYAGNNKYSSVNAEARLSYEITPSIQLVTGLNYLNEKLFDPKTYGNTNSTPYTLVFGGETYPPPSESLTAPQLPEYFHTGFINMSDHWNWIDDADRDVFAVYAQSSFDMKELLSMDRGVDSLSLVLGFRYDHYSDVGGTFNPRAGIVYAPAEDLYFKILYGRAFRAPSFQELHITQNTIFNSNEDLKPEIINSIEAQIGYNITKNILSNITVFNLSTTDLIQLAAVENAGYLQYKNIGKTETNGVEAELKIAYDKQKYAYANITYQIVTDKTHQAIKSDGGKAYAQKDFNPGYTAEVYGNFGINYDIFEYMTANVSVNYVGEKARSEEKKWDDETLVRNDWRNPTDARILLNASLTFGNFVKDLEFQISGFNLLDEDHRDPETEPDKLPNDYPRPDRTFMTRLMYSF